MLRYRTNAFGQGGHKSLNETMGGGSLRIRLFYNPKAIHLLSGHLTSQYLPLFSQTFTGDILIHKKFQTLFLKLSLVTTQLVLTLQKFQTLPNAYHFFVSLFVRISLVVKAHVGFQTLTPFSDILQGHPSCTNNDR